MTDGTRDGRYGPMVGVPEVSGRLDDITAARIRALAEDTSADPQDIRRAQRRIIAERRQAKAAELARQRSAVDLLNRDVAAAVNLVTRGN